MKREPERVLGERVVDGRCLGVGFLDDAGNQTIGGEAALLHQPGDDAETAAAGRRLEISGFVAVGIENSADVDALDQILASFDVIGEIVETGFDIGFAHIVVGQTDAVEGNVARPRELDQFDGGLLLGSGHGGYSVTGAESLSLSPKPVINPHPPSSSPAAAAGSV